METIKKEKKADLEQLLNSLIEKLIESSLKDESELEEFLLQSIVINND